MIKTQHVNHKGKIYAIANDWTCDETGVREFNIYAVIGGEEVGQPLNVSGPSGSYPSKISAIRDIKKGGWADEHKQMSKIYGSVRAT